MSLAEAFRPVKFKTFCARYRGAVSGRVGVMCSYKAVAGSMGLGGCVRGLCTGSDAVSVLFVSRFRTSRVGNVPCLGRHYGVGGIVVPCVPRVSELLFICVGGLGSFSRLVVGARRCFKGRARIVEVGPRRRSRLGGDFRDSSIGRRGGGAGVPDNAPVGVPLAASRAGSR